MNGSVHFQSLNLKLCVLCLLSAVLSLPLVSEGAGVESAGLRGLSGAVLAHTPGHDPGQ